MGEAIQTGRFMDNRDKHSVSYQYDDVRAMSPREFDRLSDFISSHCGIKMPFAKKIMLESRLQRRLRQLHVSSFTDYCKYLFDSPDGAGELVHMIDAVTTNKTDFFREPVHFAFLAETALPEFMNAGSAGARNVFHAWSAGCSSGEEPYTLAMVLGDFASRTPGFQFSILATDISTKVLEKARLGIYDEALVSGIPPTFKQKFFLRSKDHTKGLVRVVPELRNAIQFQRVNLMDEHFAISQAVDVIFCRNVIIYFDRDTQHRLLDRLCRYLKQDGYLFLGHSETVHGFDLPLARVASTIYRKVA